jgi:hypothetical protein
MNLFIIYKNHVENLVLTYVSVQLERGNKKESRNQKCERRKGANLMALPSVFICLHLFFYQRLVKTFR